jgi:hypothetical protein
MPLESLGSTSVALLAVLELEFFCAGSGTMVDVDEERLKVLARGARCVSLSSAAGQTVNRDDGQENALLVIFQDMAAAV